MVIQTVVAPFSLATSLPGLGNTGSQPSSALQAGLRVFALKISGSPSNVCWAFALGVPVMDSGAQAMYISREPILLNHVQARVALPTGMSSGMV